MGRYISFNVAGASRQSFLVHQFFRTYLTMYRYAGKEILVLITIVLKLNCFKWDVSVYISFELLAPCYRPITVNLY